MNRKFFLLLAGSAILSWVLFTPARAFGQGNTWAGESLRQMVEAARLRLGILRVNAAFELNNAGYDSDIYYGYLAEPIHDYTFSAGTPVQLLLPVSKKIVLDVFDNPQYVFYLDTKNERAWNNTFRGQVHFALDRIYIRAGGGLSNIRQRLSPELNVNVREKKDSLNGTLLWQASRAISFALLYGGSQFDYGDAEFGGTRLAETLNRKEDYFDFVTYFQPNSSVRFFLDGQYGTYVFTEEPSSLRDTRSFGAFCGLEFIPRTGETRRVAGMQGSISLGYKRFDMIDPQFVDGSGFVGAVNVSLGLLARTTGRAFFSRDFQFSVYSNTTYYTSTAYGGGITWLLSRRTSIAYDISFDRSSYPDNTMGGGLPQDINYRYTTHIFSLNLRLARNLGIMVFGTIGRRIMNETGLASNRNFFGFNLIYGITAGQISTPLRGLAR